VTVLCGGIALAQASFAETPAGDPLVGKQKAGMCRTCHGLDGVAKIPIAPHIGGETATYIASQLQAFRSGARVQEMMSVVAQGLDDQAIADLAAWYSSHKASGALPPGKTQEQAPEACVACHGANGIAVNPDAPNLAGENTIYIETQLKAFRTGKRTHAVMSEIAADLTDADMRAAADWYAGTILTVTAPK
jgi:cytochrome c553